MNIGNAALATAAPPGIPQNAIGAVTTEIHFSFARQIYCGRPETWNLDRAKAPRFNDRKSVHISNIERFAIAHPRELSLKSKAHF